MAEKLNNTHETLTKFFAELAYTFNFRFKEHSTMRRFHSYLRNHIPWYEKW